MWVTGGGHGGEGAWGGIQNEAGRVCCCGLCGGIWCVRRDVVFMVKGDRRGRDRVGSI